METSADSLDTRHAFVAEPPPSPPPPVAAGDGLDGETPEAPPPPEGTAAKEKFDAGLAGRYSVATFGAAQVWMLFNQGMPEYLRTYGLPPWLIGLLANERSFVGALVQPIVGRISDGTRTRLGRRRPFFLVGIPLMCLALILLAVHPPFWIMLGIMTIAALFLFIAIDPYTAMMADLFPAEQRGRVGGLTAMANASGAIVFALAAYLLWTDHEPWIFAMVIGILVVTWTFTFFTVKEPPLPPRAATRERSKLTLEAPIPRVVEYVKNLLRYPQAFRFTLAMILFWMGNGGATPYVTLFGKTSLGLKNGQEFLLAVAYIGVTVLLAVPAGLVADRIGKKRVLWTGLLIYGVGALVGSQSPNLTTAVIALGVIGVGNACQSAVMMALLTEMLPPKRYAELVGLFSSVTSLAQPAGSLLAGAVVMVMWSMSGSEGAGYRWAFIASGIFIIIGMFVLQTVNVLRGKEDAAAGNLLEQAA